MTRGSLKESVWEAWSYKIAQEKGRGTHEAWKPQAMFAKSIMGRSCSSGLAFQFTISPAFLRRACLPHLPIPVRLSKVDIDERFVFNSHCNCRSVFRVKGMFNKRPPRSTQS